MNGLIGALRTGSGHCRFVWCHTSGETNVLTGLLMSLLIVKVFFSPSLLDRQTRIFKRLNA